MTPATRWDVLGESIDGYAREYVCMPAHFFTKAPAGYADGTQVKVFADYITHTPKGRLDLYVVGEEKPGRVVASAAGRSMPQQLRVDRASQRRVDES